MLVHVLNLLLLILAAALLVPALVFSIQCLAALLPERRITPRKSAQSPAARPRVGVVMPAHNEEAGVVAALASIQPQLQQGDRILVVADNCTDRTAAVAAAAGAQVVERTDADRRGKGFALDFGLSQMAEDRPDVVIICDSDCEAHPGMVDALARQVQATGRPAQAIYLMSVPPDPQPRDAVSAFAFLVKNLVRPRGLARLGLPCMLTGTGMAFPWDIIRGARLASGNIVEDLQLGIELAMDGHAPLLCTPARVTGQLPRAGKAARQQRTRWEHGFLQTAIHWVPQLLLKGTMALNWQLLSVAFDLAVPPLALLVVVMVLACSASTLALLLGVTWQPAALTAAGLSAVAISVLAAWARFGRSTLPVEALLSAPAYVASKFPIYFSFVMRRETHWIRTERADEGDGDDRGEGNGDGHGGGGDDDGRPPKVDASTQLPTIQLQGVRFNSITERQCIEHVLRELAHGRGGMLVTPNLDHLHRCRRDTAYASLIGDAEIVVADGMPLVWASRLQRTPLPERVAGSDMISSLSEAAALEGRSIFLLGGNPGSAEKAAEVLTSRYPTLEVRGTHCPPMGFDLNPEMLSEVIDKLTAARPDIVYVGLGSPKQERLIHELREWLPSAWWLGVGYSFSFLAGDGKRAPVWMQQAGLEWVHRLSCEPGRLAKRYLVDGLPFAARLLTRSAISGVTGRARREVAARPTQTTKLTLRRPRKPVVGLSQREVASLVHHSFSAGLGPDWSRPTRGGMNGRVSAVPSIARERALRAVVLLGGSIRPTPFRTAINRSIMDMPIEEGVRLMLYWQQQVVDLARAYDLDQLPTRVQVNRGSPLPAAAKAIDGCAVSIERDRGEYRGTGGILRDLAEEYDDDDFILVANGGQILTHSLVEMLHQLHEVEADVSFVAHQDGAPSGLMLVRCEALRMISARGYVDMKEQALPAIARRFKVTHIEQRRATGLPLHSLQDYLAAVRWWHRHGAAQAHLGLDAIHSAEARVRESKTSFSIVESGATVDPTAHLHDCVVLRGAKVAEGAVVARSVLCAGSSLEANETAVDELLYAGGPSARRRRILQVA